MGDNIKYGAQSGVTKNMKGNQTVIGYPAMPKKKYIKSKGNTPSGDSKALGTLRGRGCVLHGWAAAGKRKEKNM